VAQVLGVSRRVVLFVVVFVKGWKLSVVSMMQTTLYAVVTLGAGVLLFGEVLSSKQALGLVFAIVGVVLLSF
jgi:drug/metabolite transporter (DMT)-like permease